MTDQIFEKAQKLRNNIGMLRRKKEQLEKTQGILKLEKTSSVLETEYRVEISGGNGKRALVWISPDSVELAIKAEEERTANEIKDLQKEFAELH